MSLDDTITHLRHAKATKNAAERLGHMRIARATLQQDSLDLEKQLRSEDVNALPQLAIADDGSILDPMDK